MYNIYAKNYLTYKDITKLKMRLKMKIKKLKIR